jgi:hypothetical protein
MVSQKPAVDYFSVARQQSQNNTSSFTWDQSPTYSEPALVNYDSCDSGSILPSPTSPISSTFPASSYKLPKDELANERKPEQAFNFGTFEDWMRWDDPSDAALSPTSNFFPELKVEPLSPNMGALQLNTSNLRNSPSINPSAISTSIDTSAAVFGDDNIAEDRLFQTSSSLVSPAEVPSRLYSTPLSWSPPAPGNSTRLTNSYNSMLSPQEESKLRDIAMPTQYPGSPSSVSSPETHDSNMRKRKSSVDEDEDEDDVQEETSGNGNGRHPPKKTAHNMIEKRYRTNLNDKIAALRDSVPALRVMIKKNSRGEEIQEDLQGLTPAHKLNKATVLSKATEYIAHLEKCNKYLTKENASLKARVDAFEILVMSRQSPQSTPRNNGNIQLQRQNAGRYDGRM